jgi:predicted glycosyltransferase
MEELRQRGVETLITLRSFGQTEELAQAYGMEYALIGEHRTPRHSPE